MSFVLEFFAHLGRSSRRALKRHSVSSISRDRKEELLNYWPPVPSVYPQMTQIKIVGTS